MMVTWVFLLRLHYFLAFGAIGGVQQYVVVFAQNHIPSVSETSIGILLATVPLTCLASRPLICYLADLQNAHKFTLIISILGLLFGYGLFALIPLVSDHIKWSLFCSLVVLASHSQGVFTSLTDSFAMTEVTNNNNYNYGSFRVFYSTGYGLCALLAGYLNELGKTTFPYLVPGIIMCAVLLLIDLILMTVKFKRRERTLNSDKVQSNINNVAQPEKPKGSSSRLTPIKFIVRNPSCIRYALIATVFGTLTVIQWYYFNAFLEKISHQNTLLMGICSAFQCLLGEPPFFLLANRIVKLLGPTMTLTVGLLSFAIRHACYAYLITPENVYMVLLVELLQGPTSSLYYYVIATVAQEISLDNDTKKASIEIGVSEANGTAEKNYATLQGVFGACFEGAGFAIGSFIAGLLNEPNSSHRIWLFGVTLALSTALLNLVLDLIVNIVRRRRKCSN